MMKQLNLQKLRMVKLTKKVLQQLIKAQDLKRALRMKQMMMKRLNLQKLRKQTRMVKPTKKVLQQLMKAQDLCQICTCQKCHKFFENKKDVFDHMSRKHPVIVETSSISSTFEHSMDTSVVYSGKLLSEREANIIHIKETLLYKN